jgi:hypothetical protein
MSKMRMSSTDIKLEKEGRRQKPGGQEVIYYSYLHPTPYTPR